MPEEGAVDDRRGTAVRLQQVVLATALIVPAVLFAGAIIQNHSDVLREGRDGVERTSAIMQEQARKVFETADLVIAQVNERIDGTTWDTIAAPATSEFLARIKAPMDQLVSISIADRDGVVRAASQPWTASDGIGRREFFLVHKAAVRGPYIGINGQDAAAQAPAPGTPAQDAFAISQAVRTASGGFDGTIHVAVSPAYLTRFYVQAAPPMPHIALLIRDDGAILARDPPRSGPQVLRPDAPLMRRLATGDTGGFYSEPGKDGVLQDYAFRKVGPYPAFVAFIVPHHVLLGRWYDNLRMYGVAAGGAALTLLLVSWLALRRAQAEQAALARLRAETRQRAAAEQQLRHAQRMDAVGQLTGGVAHDFNNLLTAILGNLELIQRSAGAPDSKERIIRLSTVAMKAVLRGATLTKSLLAFSRKQPLQPKAIDVSALLADFLDLLRQAAGPTIAVQFSPDEGLPLCLADPAELEAAILNLAINARDALAERRGVGDEAPVLSIRTRAATLDTADLVSNAEARPGAFVAIVVSDNGTGMAPDVAAKAFEPFFTTKPIGQGTGLGLSQVFGFARQLGGHVTLESAPGQGTVVTIHLPVADG